MEAFGEIPEAVSCYLLIAAQLNADSLADRGIIERCREVMVGELGDNLARYGYLAR